LLKLEESRHALIDRLFRAVSNAAAPRIRGQLQRLQTERLDNLEKTEVGRRLDRDDVARPRNGLQRDCQRLGTAAGDGDVVVRQQLAPAQRTAGDLVAQLGIALGDGIAVVVDALDARRPREEAIQAAGRQQFGAGDGAAQRHQPRIGRMLQQLEHDTGDGDAGGPARQRRAGRRRQRSRRLPRNVEAGLRPGFEAATVLQQAIGLQRRGQADPALAADLPERGRACAWPERAAVDQGRDEVRQLLIAETRIGPPGHLGLPSNRAARKVGAAPPGAAPPPTGPLRTTVLGTIYIICDCTDRRRLARKR
jgi:hypothetical protein